MVKHISCDCKCEFSSTTCNSKEKWNTEICPCESKNYCMCKNDYSWNPSKKYCWWLKSCTPWNYTCHGYCINKCHNYCFNKFWWQKRYKMDCDILHRVLLVIILVFTIAIICYYYAKYRSKLKKNITILKL